MTIVRCEICNGLDCALFEESRESAGAGEGDSLIVRGIVRRTHASGREMGGQDGGAVQVVSALRR